MSKKRFEKSKSDITDYRIYDYEKEDAYFIDCDDESTVDAIVDLMNEQQATISQLEEEKGYWKSKAMTLLMQVRRLTPRMTEKEVIEFSKELEDE